MANVQEIPRVLEHSGRFPPWVGSRAFGQRLGNRGPRPERPLASSSTTPSVQPWPVGREALERSTSPPRPRFTRNPAGKLLRGSRGAVRSPYAGKRPVRAAYRRPGSRGSFDARRSNLSDRPRRPLGAGRRRSMQVALIRVACLDSSTLVRLLETAKRLIRELRKRDLAPLGAVLVATILGAGAFAFIVTAKHKPPRSRFEATIRTYFETKPGPQVPHVSGPADPRPVVHAVRRRRLRNATDLQVLDFVRASTVRRVLHDRSGPHRRRKRTAQQT